MFSILNLLKLFVIFLLCLPIFFISKNRALFLFLRFSGPSFIKLGQILASRPDVVGQSLANSLSVFQDRLPSFCQKSVRKILKEEFGDDFNKIFQKFEFVSSSSASIAQVHKANLQDGSVVAVKILRPKIRQTMAQDILTLRLISKILRIFSKSLSKAASDIANLLDLVAKSELDLLQEASNASRLKDDLKDVKGFYVPKVFWKFSTSKILVLEWLDGISFSNKEEILAAPFDKKQIAQNLVISYFNQVYSNGFFHADMHQGNLFLLKNGDIGVVDFGIVGQIDKKTRLAIAEILIGFLNKDYQRVAQIHIDAGLVPSYTNVDRLALSCRRIGETIVGSDVKDISVAKLLTNLIAMTREYEMDARPDLLLLQKTIFLVEAVGIMLDPNLNIWDLARPWIKTWAKQNLGFDAKIRDAIFDLFEVAKKFLRAN